MISWEDRPVEVAALLNPAFCGEILRRCIRSYEAAAQRAFPFPLAYLALPIVLHRKTRDQIGLRQRQGLHAWLHNHPDVRVGFAVRARSLVPVTREALAFLLHTQVIVTDGHGALASWQGGSQGRHRGGPQSRSARTEGEVADCYTKAEVIGRLFARAGTTATIYAMWGVTP